MAKLEKYIRVWNDNDGVHYEEVDPCKNGLTKQDMKFRVITPSDKDYPSAMRLVPFKEKYTLIGIDDLIVVPLFQVMDAISILNPNKELGV